MEITAETARRLAITKQHLSASLTAPTREGILDVIRALGCLQLDPISVVERTHLLVLWSRLGNYNRADLEHIMWEERCLFEYWAHCASIVLTEDYPIHHHHMRRYVADDSTWAQRVRAWLESNTTLRDEILDTMRENGPVMSKDIGDKAHAGWYSTGWTSERNVSQMLDFLWLGGQIMVAGRKGGQKQWDLSERVLPEWTPREELSGQEVVRRAVQKSLRALGVGKQQEINMHFTRGHYPGLKAVLGELEEAGIITRVSVTGDAGKALPGPYYVHSDDLPVLERIEGGEWEGRTTLLSPFDNLICDRKRTRQLFNFDYRIEIYTPVDKREYGYYVLPILHNSSLIGRIDPRMDRKARRLYINAVYAEVDAPLKETTGKAVAGAVKSLAEFLGAEAVEYSEKVPEGWKSSLH